MLRRHPFVVAFVLLLNLLGVLYIQRQPPVYRVAASLVLISPGIPSSNRYETFSERLIVLGNVLCQWISGEQGREQVVRRGGTAEYQVELVNEGTQEIPLHEKPYIRLSAISNTAEDADHTLAVVLKTFEAELRRLQVDIGSKESAIATMQLVDNTDQPIPVFARRSRAIGAVAVLTVLCVMSAALFFERWPIWALRRRRQNIITRRKTGASHG
ncbi:hypothetical protein GCM10017600_77780 [Streptosporangium carneum]|uniref:Uncharacterized protein n=1 Tax=Streptosporangium carneum TaxID=47481 RepID=A0A9W6MHL6_9ACTN|nr:hypothetical protein GCM10017600_77780 [Streptosporangium carneum]